MPTFNAFWPRFLDGYALANRQKPSGIAAKETIGRVHLLPHVGLERLDAITTERVQHLKHALADRASKSEPFGEAQGESEGAFRLGRYAPSLKAPFSSPFKCPKGTMSEPFGEAQGEPFGEAQGESNGGGGGSRTLTGTSR